MKKLLLQGKRLLVISMSILLVVVTILISKGNVYANPSEKQEIRTVSYKEKEINSESLFEGFDNHQEIQNDDGFEIIAIKKFNKSTFEDLNLVDLNSSGNDVDVRYSIEYVESQSKILLYIYMDGNNDEIPLVETIPGIVTTNESGEVDVLFAIEEETSWLTDLVDTSILNETGLWSWLKSVVVKVIALGFRLAAKVVVKKVGLENCAKVLSMYKDSYGDYHADFDCWQAIGGYNKFYDYVFDLGSVMLPSIDEFLDEDSDGKADYVLWGWKGDYWELGAGGELGIYRRLGKTDNWYVDHKLAIDMTLKVEYSKNGKNGWTTIIDWNPSSYYSNGTTKDKKQWWITGFDPAYLNKVTSVEQLRVTYTVKFVTMGYSGSFDEKLRKAFKDALVDTQHKWNYKESTKMFTYTF